MRRVGGIIQLQVNGEVYRAKGNFTHNLGRPKRDAVVGADGVHGYTEQPQVSFIEGEITDDGIDVVTLTTLTEATVTLDLANGKMFVLRDAWFAGEGTGNTQEGNLGVRFEGMGADEVR